MFVLDPANWPNHPDYITLKEFHNFLKNAEVNSRKKELKTKPEYQQLHVVKSDSDSGCDFYFAGFSYICRFTLSRELTEGLQVGKVLEDKPVNVFNAIKHGNGFALSPVVDGRYIKSIGKLFNEDYQTAEVLFSNKCKGFLFCDTSRVIDGVYLNLEDIEKLLPKHLDFESVRLSYNTPRSPLIFHFGPYELLSVPLTVKK